MRPGFSGVRPGFNRGFDGGFRHSGNRFSINLGFGHRRWGSSWFGGGFGYPVSWGTLGYPVYGYPVYGYPWIGSPWLATSGYGVGWGYPTYVSGNWGTPYGYGFGSMPAVVDASQVIVNPPAPPVDGRLEEVPLPPQERYYLDRRAPVPTSLVELARTQIRVEEAEPGAYLVRWLGPAEGLSLVELQAVDATGQVLASRLLKEAPYRGLLRTPEKTAAVLLTVEQKNGASASVKLPLAEFKALDEK